MEKKKVGRPKKVVIETPQKTVKNATYYKQAFNELKEAYDQLYAKNLSLHHEKEKWFQIADIANKDQEALVSLVKSLVDTAINDLLQVEVTTGKITSLDAIYHVSMIERVMEANDNSETEE